MLKEEVPEKASRYYPRGPQRVKSYWLSSQLTHHPRRCSGHRQDHLVCSPHLQHHRHTILTAFSVEISRPFKAKLRRSFATVQDPPVRRYGGLRDQDRIFTNAYCRHDHGIKGAMVCLQTYLFSKNEPFAYIGYSPAEIGTERKTFSPKATPGLSKQSRTLVFVDVVGQGFLVVSNGVS